MQTTINGLHKCQPKNEPIQGETKNMVVLNMPAKGGKKAWIRIKSERPEKGGSPYRIVGVDALDWPPDDYGNIAFNLEVEAVGGQQGRTRDMQDADPHGQHGEVNGPPHTAYKSPQVRQNAPNGEDGVTDARKHLMRSSNLLNLCVDAVDKAVAPHVPVIARTEGFFQAQVATLFIEASRAGFVDRMPTTPIKHDAPKPEPDEEPPF